MRFALAGNQNCGKTTLFNQLTGSNQHVGNFPGVTVDSKSGSIRIFDPGHIALIIGDQISVLDVFALYKVFPSCRCLIRVCVRFFCCSFPDAESHRSYTSDL